MFGPFWLCLARQHELGEFDHDGKVLRLGERDAWHCRSVPTPGVTLKLPQSWRPCMSSGAEADKCSLGVSVDFPSASLRQGAPRNSTTTTATQCGSHNHSPRRSCSPLQVLRKLLRRGVSTTQASRSLRRRHPRGSRRSRCPSKVMPHRRHASRIAHLADFVFAQIERQGPPLQTRRSRQHRLP